MDRADELGRAALAIKVRADCGPGSFWSALAGWLETEARMVDIRGNSPEGQTFSALAVARAYLDGGVSVSTGAHTSHYPITSRCECGGPALHVQGCRWRQGYGSVVVSPVPSAEDGGEPT